MTITTSVAQPVPSQDLSGIVGHRFIYTYANGWQYEMYVKNATTIDYRIHSGMVGGRWVKDQQVDLVVLTAGVYKVSWNEPTGTSVVVTVVPGERVLHGTIFFPALGRGGRQQDRAVPERPPGPDAEYRDAGPTYPIYVVPEFAHITLFEFVGQDDETVVDTAPADLPAGFADRSN
ncbi:phenolic acid decarboxylase [Curtobacterium flaccumfaciens]|nr:phenolic acid decarboxylase [Curtobacterium flaccumfaciens]